MVSMNKYKYMIEEGIDFDTVKDINKLCLYLGSDMRKVRLIDISISLIIGVINALIVFLLTYGKKLYFLYVFVVLISIGIYLFLHFIKNFNKRRSEYIDSIKKKYDELFDTYLGYDKYLIGFVQNSKNKFRTNTAILLTNGYKIVITEDPFASSGYKVCGKDIKVLSERVYDFKKMKFIITDILKFKLNGKIEENGNIEDKSYENDKFDTMTLTLKDFESYELSSNAYNIFMKLVELKEEKHEE